MRPLRVTGNTNEHFLIKSFSARFLFSPKAMDYCLTRPRRAGNNPVHPVNPV